LSCFWLIPKPNLGPSTTYKHVSNLRAFQSKWLSIFQCLSLFWQILYISKKNPYLTMYISNDHDIWWRCASISLLVAVKIWTSFDFSLAASNHIFPHCYMLNTTALVLTRFTSPRSFTYPMIMNFIQKLIPQV
jgi:hypothetical protein